MRIRVGHLYPEYLNIYADRGNIAVLARRAARRGHELAVEADRQARGPGPADTRRAAARRFLEAIWRYYNLVDYTVSQRDAKAAAGVRLAFEEAEAVVKDGAPPDGVDAIGAPLRRIARRVADLIQTSATTARRES